MALLRTLATPFPKWGLDQAEMAIQAAREEQRERFLGFPTAQTGAGATVGNDPHYISGRDPLLVNRAFVQGDHWQNGDGWIGPMPDMGDTGYDVTLTMIQQAFVSLNVILECTQRHASGVVGNEPHWTFTPKRAIKDGEKPTDAEQALIDEAVAYVKEWWDDRKVHALLQTATSKVLWTERSMVRLYVPEGFLEASGDRQLVRASSIDEALSLIYLSDPEPEQSVVVEDPRTKERCGIVKYLRQEFDDDGMVGDDLDVAEFSYREGPLTVIRQIVEDGDETSVKLDFGGRLTMHEMRRPLMITRQVQEQQRALNLARSMIPRNVVTSGFLERVIMNAQMPGTWTEDANGKKLKFTPDPYQAGPGVTDWLTGLVTTDPDTGKQTMQKPDVKWREPSPVEPTREAGDTHYQDLLNECNQLHVLMNKDARASGKSREQARADYQSSLGKTRGEVEPLGRWLLETVLAMAETFAGAPGKYTKTLRAVFSCRLDTGPVAADERKANDSSYAAGTMSLESTMQRNGVVDTDAEMAMIAQSDDTNLTVLTKQAAVVLTLNQSGVDVVTAAEIVGMDEDAIKLLEKMETDKAAEGDPNAPIDPLTGLPVVQPPGAVPPGAPKTNGKKSPPPDPQLGNNPVPQPLATVAKDKALAGAGAK